MITTESGPSGVMISALADLCVCARPDLTTSCGIRHSFACERHAATDTQMPRGGGDAGQCA